MKFETASRTQFDHQPTTVMDGVIRPGAALQRALHSRLDIDRDELPAFVRAIRDAVFPTASQSEDEAQQVPEAASRDTSCDDGHREIAKALIVLGVIAAEPLALYAEARVSCDSLADRIDWLRGVDLHIVRLTRPDEVLQFSIQLHAAGSEVCLWVAEFIGPHLHRLTNMA